MIRGAVLGSPISHSLSPLLHNSAFEFLGVEGSYSAIEVRTGELQDFIRNRGSDFDYLSLTMPLKEEVLSLGFEHDTLTERIQSGNTLINRNSSWNVMSTDGSGLLAALAHVGLRRFDSVLVLGAGGTARAVTGALDPITKNLHVLGRSSARQKAIEAALTFSYFEYHKWSEEVDFSQYDLVVNTTPAGAADLLANCVHPGIRATLFDVIYTPWPTALAQSWSACAGRVINGVELLLYQGIDQLNKVLQESIKRDELSDYLRPILQNAAR